MLEIIHSEVLLDILDVVYIEVMFDIISGELMLDMLDIIDS